MTQHAETEDEYRARKKLAYEQAQYTAANNARQQHQNQAQNQTRSGFRRIGTAVGGITTFQTPGVQFEPFDDPASKQLILIMEQLKTALAEVMFLQDHNDELEQEIGHLRDTVGVPST